MEIMKKVVDFEHDGYTINFLDRNGNIVDTADEDDIIRTYIDLMKTFDFTNWG